MMVENTRAKILAAALDEFATKGLAGVRVDQIAELAGVNKAMIYYHFASKEDLFKAVFESEMEGLKAQLAAITPRQDLGSIEGQIAAVEAMLAYAGERKKFLSILLSTALMQPVVQPHLFQLLDVSTTAGLSLGSAPGEVTKPPDQEALLHELFTGLLPLMTFILLREGLASYYGWDEAGLKQAFIQNWLRQHLGSGEKPPDPA